MKIVLFHRTVGPEHDDRLHKMFGTFERVFPAQVRAYLWDRSNIPREGEFPNGGSWQLLELPFASKRQPRPGALYTAYEIVVETIQALSIIRRNRPQVVIIQTHRLFLLGQFLVLLFKKRIRLVWDLRELPKGFYNNGALAERYFSYLVSQFDAVIATNKARRKFLEDVYDAGRRNRLIVLPNYPSEAWLSSEDDKIFNDKLKMVGSQRYFYIQSAGTVARYPYNSVKAILLGTDFLVVIAGSFDKTALVRLKEEFGMVFEDRVIMVGMLSGGEIGSVLSRAFASLIFYESSDPNNELCEPNRLYQAIAKGVPVVVGCNKGLSEPVGKLRCGVVAADDGFCMDSIVVALKELVENYGEYKQNAVVARHDFIWEKVEANLLKAVLETNSSVKLPIQIAND